MEATLQQAKRRAGIGINPLITTPLLIIFTGFIVFSIGGFATILLALFWVPFSLYGLFHAAQGFFCHLSARAHILSGKITPTTVIRGLNCLGIAMFDENNRKAYINGTIYDYDDITEINWLAGKRETSVSFNLKHGKSPVKKVRFCLQRSSPIQHQRALNALNWN